jgi:Cysteine-rich domain
MRVAYWPGCVSRGFTPELHGAKVAPLLDIELIELDRANCCGAGVIAEHNQELADTLNARTFALAQQTDGELMMNICSTCQGGQSECQERLDANTEYRERVNANLTDQGLRYEKGLTNKNFLWLLVEDIGLDELRSRVKRPLRAARGSLLRLLHRAAGEPAGDRRRAPSRPLPAPADRGARRDRDRLRGRVQVLRLPDRDHEQTSVTVDGRAPRR